MGNSGDWRAMGKLILDTLTNEGESYSLEMSLTTDMGVWECRFAMEGWAADIAVAKGGTAPEAVDKAAFLVARHRAAQEKTQEASWSELDCWPPEKR